jgi:two-component system OmpR family sensor kinase
MARPSIAWRLAIGLSAGTAVLWIGAASIAGVVMNHELNQAFDETLRQSALRLLPLAIHDLREPRERSETRVAGLDAAEEYFTYYVRDRDGAIVVRAEDAPPELVSVAVTDGFSEIDGKHLFAITDPRSGYSIVVAERTDQRSEALKGSLAALTLPLAALIPLIALGIWFAIRLAMRPVERLSQEIAKRDGKNLSPLTMETHPVELAPIADAVANLLARLRDALDAERAFAASSAHELRTPIAGALAQTQQLAIELGNRPGSERLKEIEFALHNLARLSEKLLQFARVEAGFAQDATANDLLPVLKLVVRDFQARTATAKRVRLTIADGADLKACINVDAFAIALRNLIQNGLIHGQTDGVVDITAGPGRSIRVVNSGTIVPAETLAHIGEPFVRGTTSAQGTGLGLSIVRSIMDQTGGSLSLHSPASGADDGFEAIITLPG